MLPDEHRLRRPQDFALAVRRGRRAGRPSLVLHLRPAPAHGGQLPARVGLVVGKAVGPAVVRNRVKRRLRELLRTRLGVLPAASVLVVRALPPAGVTGFAVLGSDLDAALERLLAGGPR